MKRDKRKSQERLSQENKFGWWVGWLVVLLFGISTLIGSFNAELNFKKLSLV